MNPEVASKNISFYLRSLTAMGSALDGHLHFKRILMLEMFSFEMCLKN